MKSNLWSQQKANTFQQDQLVHHLRIKETELRRDETI